MQDINFVERIFLRRIALSFLKKHLANIGAIAIPIVTFLQPSLHALVVNNPKSAVGVLIAALLTAYNAPSPWSQRGVGQ